MSEDEKYWNGRYRLGGLSGKGVVGKHREWKWSQIINHVKNIDSVVDIGCGDLRFWQGRTCNNYVGLDFSKIIIDKNRSKRPKWKFIYANARDRVNGLKGNIVFCLEVLYHIMSLSDYINTLYNLCYYSERWIFISTWLKNPWTDKTTDDRYQYYRSLEENIEIFHKSLFNLLTYEKDPYSDTWLYVFKKG